MREICGGLDLPGSPEMCGERCTLGAPLSFFVASLLCGLNFGMPTVRRRVRCLPGPGARCRVPDAFRPGIRPGVLSENSVRSARMHENGAEPSERFRPVGLWEGGIYSRNPTEIVKHLSKGSSAAPPKRQAASQRTGPTMNPHPAAA